MAKGNAKASRPARYRCRTSYGILRGEGSINLGAGQILSEEEFSALVKSGNLTTEHVDRLDDVDEFTLPEETE